MKNINEVTKQEFIKLFNAAKLNQEVVTRVHKKMEGNRFYVSVMDVPEMNQIMDWFRDDADSRGWVMELNALI
jgi:hypothetical protein